MPKKPSPENPSCPYCRNHPTIKWGNRKNKQRTIQKYQCKACKKHFTSQHKLQKSKTHSLKTILNTISNYNLGTPIRKQNIPSSTIHNWIKQLKQELPFNRIRERTKQTNPDNIIIKKQFIHHQQPFLYQYHSIKLNFAKKYKGLIKYLKHLYLPKDIFNNSERISETDNKNNNNIHLIKKQNYAVKLAQLALQITKDNKERHQVIENFMLINDTATIATEIPIYIKNNKKPLTGHIDILQIRYNNIYILDYKPEPVDKKQTINQLLLYKEALSRRTYIPKHKFKLAFFNDAGYYEF